MCLDPLLNKRAKNQSSYQEHLNEDVNSSALSLDKIA